MTLCMAWKTVNNIHFASDSRITLRKTNLDNYVDVGIKVFSIPVKIYSPINFDTGEQTLDYNHFIGLCFSGYATNGYVAKETIYEVLQRLQYTKDTEFSMDGIAKIIAKFYQHISVKLCEELYEDGKADFFITGFCPKDKFIKTYKFELITEKYPPKAIYNKILIDNGIEFLGSGKKAAEKLLLNHANIEPLKLLRIVNQDEEVPSVGGNIQYGDFDENNDFTIKGVDDFEIIDEEILNRKLLLRGTQLYEKDITFDSDDFYISYTFIQPFESEIKEFMKKNNFES